MSLYPKHLTVIFIIFILITFLPGNLYSANFPRENAVVKAIKRVSRAVVNISSQYEVVERSNPFFDFGLDHFNKGIIKYRQRESVVLLIQRGNQQYYVIVKINA